MPGVQPLGVSNVGQVLMVGTQHEQLDVNPPASVSTPAKPEPQQAALLPTS